VVDTSFEAANGTLLENYSNTHDTNAKFVRVAGEGQTVNGAFVGADQVTGDVIYRTAQAPSSPNYSVTYVVHLTIPNTTPSSGTTMWVQGRSALDGSVGYRAAVTSDGLALHLSLTAIPASVPLATVAMGAARDSYTVTLDMKGTRFTVTAQRAADSLWLNSTGGWAANKTPAILVSDTTNQTAGQVLFGGNWTAQ